MSRNGSGTYSLPAGNPVVTGTTIASTWANNTLTDISTALTGSLASDGQTTATGNLKMGANRITGLADGLAPTDAASITQVTSAVAITGGSIDGTTIGTTTRSSVKATTLDLGLATQSVAIGQGNASIMKNRIINGAMVIDQRNAGASVSTSSGTGVYTLDRFAAQYSATSKFTIQQSSTAPSGFVNSALITSSAATTVSSGDYYTFGQRIEGYNIADLGWGTASAKTVTLSFQVRSSLTGTFGGSLTNDNQDRSYPFTYTISSANTWTQASITIAGDTTGTWGTTNGSGIKLWLGLGVGSSASGTAGAWAGTQYLSATGATSVVGTNGATFYITGVQLEVGSSATGYEYRQYQQELALCQRYCVRYDAASSIYTKFSIGNTQTTVAAETVLFTPVSMRSTPSLTTTGTASNYAVYSANAITACSVVPAVASYTTNGIEIICTVASGLTAGRAFSFISNNNNTAYLLFTSEL
jgi:hypothetical protein